MTNPRIQLIERFFAALEAGDFQAVEQIYADNVIVWHNNDNKEKDKAGSMAILHAVFGTLEKPRYEVLRRYDIPGGVAQSHILHATKPDGSAFSIHAAIFFECDDKHITRLEEYVDSATFMRQFKSAS